MRNARKSGQILRSKKRPRPTLRSGRGSRTNSNTFHQIPARVIEADSARAVWVPVPDPRLAQLIPEAIELVFTKVLRAWRRAPDAVVVPGAQVGCIFECADCRCRPADVFGKLTERLWKEAWETSQ